MCAVESKASSEASVAPFYKTTRVITNHGHRKIQNGLASCRIRFARWHKEAAKDGARFSRMAQGRWLSNDPMERLCTAVRFICQTGNSHRPVEKDHAAGRKRPRHLCHARTMGTLVHHPRLSGD